MGKLQVLINDQELAETLAQSMLIRCMARTPISWESTDHYVQGCMVAWRDTGSRQMDFVQLHTCIQKDLDDFCKRLRKYYKKFFRPLTNFLADNLRNLDRDQEIIDRLRAASKQGFIQATARQLGDIEIQSVRQCDPLQTQEILIRNVVNNEDILKQRIHSGQPFWFMDSGYTNHLCDKKTWHRLVRSGIHTCPDLTKTWPADRLGNLQHFPRNWNLGGSKILIVESSPGHYRLHDMTLENWREKILKQLNHANLRKKTVFYPKANKKKRQSVYELLRKDPGSWYCVISDYSAAAIEAIWLGIPVITLMPHVTSPIARNDISQIGDLYRGPIGNWLCALTYSQFTKQELQDGTAVEILRKFHDA